MSTQLQRRSRFRRVPSGRRIVLGDRDFAAFRLLYRYPLLTSKDLIAYIQPQSTKRFVERLGHLYHDGGFLNRPAQQWNRANALHAPVTYSISDKGLDALFEMGPLPPRALMSEPQQPGHRIPQFQHLLMISQAVFQVENSTFQEPGQRFVPIEAILEKANANLPENRSRLSFPIVIAKSRHNPGSPVNSFVIPDAIYGIEYDEAGSKRYRFFALEAEHTSPLRRRSMKLTSTLKKLLSYQAALHSGSYKQTLGIPNLFPHFVGRDEIHRGQIEELAAEILEPTEKKLFRFSAHK